MKKKKEIRIIISYFYNYDNDKKVYKQWDKFCTKATKCRIVLDYKKLFGLEFIDKNGKKERIYIKNKFFDRLSIVNEKVYPYRYILFDHRQESFIEKISTLFYIKKVVNSYTKCV